MPSFPRNTVRRVITALGATTIALALILFLALRGTDHTTPERVLLSPTADPATSQTITWRATRDYNAVLEIAPKETPGQVTRVKGEDTPDAGGTYHAATATGLSPDTAYRYRVGDSADAVSDWHTFTTAAEDAQPFTFLYFGDIQNDIAEDAAPVVRAALDTEPDADLAVHTGDLTDSADSESQWDAWFDAFGAQATGRINHLAAPGNHDYADTTLGDHWRPQFPGAGNGPTSDPDLAETVYHTDYQGVRFIVLNSNYRIAAPHDASSWLDIQQRWLEKALRDNPHEWTVIAFHHPVFSNRPDRDNAPVRQAWLDTFEEFDVDLVLQGHDHSYGRGNLVNHRTGDPAVQTGPVYTVAVTGPKTYGVAGDNWTDNGAEARVQLAHTQTFQAVSVEGETLEYVARTADGEVVDSFTIAHEEDGKRVTDTL